MIQVRLIFGLVCGASLLLSACVKKIGDECVTDLDCSPENDRLCDTTQLGGYCTLVNCDPDSCPEKESVCVAFNNTRSPVGQCDSPVVPSPYRRNFCMGVCATSAQCRDGYICIDLAKDNDFEAEVVEKDPPSTRVCMMAESLLPIENRSDGFCSLNGQAGASGDSN